MKHTIAVIVENKSGVLTRIAGLFSRRSFNIDSLSVGATDNPDYSRMTISVQGDRDVLEQVIKQLQALQEKMDDDTICFVLSYEFAQDPKSLLGSPNPANDGSANLPAAGNTSTAVDSKEKAEAMVYTQTQIRHDELSH